jgi:outer membrane protein TolC
VSLRHLFAGFVFLSSAGLLAWGQEEPLKLDELVKEALRSNPEIAASQKRYEAARQRPSQASSLPDPMFSPGYTSNGNPLPGAQLGTSPTSSIGFMVSQEVPFPGKLKLRGNIAGKEAEAEYQNYDLTQLSVISRVKQAYYRLSYAYAATGVLERNRELLTKLLRITEARYSVGRAAQQDVYKTQTQLSILETRLVQLRREKEAREAELNSLLNRRPGSPLGKPPEPEPQILATTLNELYGYAEQNAPMLRRDQKMIERSELAVNLARKDYYPDYTVSAGYFNQGAMPAMYQARVDIKVPLYFWRKQRAGVAEQAQSLVESRRNYEATNQNLHFRIKDDYLMADTSSRLVDLYGKTVIPQSTLALQSSLSSYETGTVDFLSVLTNYITVVEYEMNYYEELQSFYVALSRLEEMTGLSLIK